MRSWLKYLLWLIGLLLLLAVSSHLQHAASARATRTFQLSPALWINTIMAFVLGIYLALPFINTKRHLNRPLLVCVFIPSTIIGFYMPVAATFSLRIPLWIAIINPHDLTAMLSGLSLMAVLFSRKID